MKNDWIEIGTIVAPHGLYGEVRVYPNSDFPERFIEPGKRWIRASETEEPRVIEFLGGRFMPGKGIYIVEIAGIEHRDAAEKLRGNALLVPDSDRPALAEDEFHVLDLIGLEVYHQTTGQLIGTVVDIISAGNDLLSVKLHQVSTPESVVSETSEPAEVHPSTRRGGRKKKPKAKPKEPTVLIPFVKAIVPVVDLAASRLEILPPAGLLEEETTQS